MVSQSENKAITTVNPEKEAWELLQRQCRAFLTSRLLPEAIWKGFDDVQALSRAITIAAKGRELGLPPLYSLSNISVINGKPVLTAEGMLALIYQRIPGSKVSFITPPEKQNEECVAVMQRPLGDPQTFKFSIKDAERAGINKNAWAKYPAAMLRARVISAGARAVFPDAIMGAYTPEDFPSHNALDDHHEEVIEPLKGVAPYQDETSLKVTKEEIRPSPSLQPPPPTSIDNYKGPISEKQIKRLFAIMHSAKWNDEEVHRWIKVKYNRNSIKDLLRPEYDDICNTMSSNRGESLMEESYTGSESPH